MYTTRLNVAIIKNKLFNILIYIGSNYSTQL